MPYLQDAYGIFIILITNLNPVYPYPQDAYGLFVTALCHSDNMLKFCTPHVLWMLMDFFL